MYYMGTRSLRVCEFVGGLLVELYGPGDTA